MAPLTSRTFGQASVCHRKPYNRDSFTLGILKQLWEMRTRPNSGAWHSRTARNLVDTENGLSYNTSIFVSMGYSPLFHIASLVLPLFLLLDHSPITFSYSLFLLYFLSACFLPLLNLDLPKCCLQHQPRRFLSSAIRPAPSNQTCGLFSMSKTTKVFGPSSRRQTTPCVSRSHDFQSRRENLPALHMCP